MLSSKNNKAEKPIYFSKSRQLYDQEVSRTYESDDIDNPESKSDLQYSSHSSPQKNQSTNSFPHEKVINLYEGEDKDPNSILNRIQINKKKDGDRKLINIRKGENDGADEFDISRIQKKVINKGPPKVITRPSSRLETDQNVRSDPFKASAQTTVILSNLSRNVNEQVLRDIIKDDESIISINVSS